MTATVRMFAYAGVRTAKISGNNGQFSTDSVQMLKQPYIGREKLTSTTPTATTSDAANAPQHTTLLYVQVDPGQRVHYEITPAGQTLRTADTSSPTLEGNTQLDFGPGYRLSVLEAE